MTTPTEARLPLSSARLNLPNGYSFSFNSQSSDNRHESCIFLASKRPIATEEPWVTAGDPKDDNGRVNSDRPWKRSRQLTSYGEAPAMFVDGWEDHLSQPVSVFAPMPRRPSPIWTEHRDTDLSRLSPSSGLHTPPVSPERKECPSPGGNSWSFIPSGLEPGEMFFLTEDFEIEGTDEQVIPLLLGLDDTIGPSHLPLSLGKMSTSDQGFFYFDPALVHIQLGISEDVDQVEVFLEESHDSEIDARLFQYLGRFAAVQCEHEYLNDMVFQMLNTKEQEKDIELVYSRQPRGRKMSKAFIREKLIGMGRWFPKVRLVPVITTSPSPEEEYPSREQMNEWMDTRDGCISVPPSNFDEDDFMSENDAEEVQEELLVNDGEDHSRSPLSALDFGSDQIPSELPLTSFPPPAADKDHCKLLGYNPPRRYIPLPECILERPLSIMAFESPSSDSAAQDAYETMEGFPDSPEQTYSSRLRQQHDEFFETCNDAYDMVTSALGAPTKSNVLQDLIEDSKLLMDPTYERSGFSFGFHDKDEEDNDEFSPRNRASLASELQLDEDEAYISSRMDDTDEEESFFVREGSNPPETWGH